MSSGNECDVAASSDNCAFFMPGRDVTVTATFIPTEFTLTIVTDGTGTGTVTGTAGGAGVNCRASCTVQVTPGRQVDLAFEADFDSTFDGATSTGGECNTIDTCSFTMPERDVTVTAVFNTFTAQDFSLNVVKNGTGGGTVVGPNNLLCGEGDDCRTTVTAGTQVDMGFTADNDSFFDGATLLGLPGVTCNEQACSFIMPDNDVIVTATFNLFQSLIQLRPDLFAVYQITIPDESRDCINLLDKDGNSPAQLEAYFDHEGGVAPNSLATQSLIDEEKVIFLGLMQLSVGAASGILDCNYPSLNAVSAGAIGTAQNTSLVLQNVSFTASYELIGPGPTNGEVAIVATLNENQEVLSQVLPSEQATRFDLPAQGIAALAFWVHPDAQLTVSLADSDPFIFEFLAP
jgi:hypothetical protein